MPTIKSFSAERVEDVIILHMEVEDGDNVWPGSKGVSADADLKVEAEILAKEIIVANTPVQEVSAPEPVPVDVSQISITI